MWFPHSDLPWHFWTARWRYPVLNWKWQRETWNERGTCHWADSCWVCAEGQVFPDRVNDFQGQTPEAYGSIDGLGIGVVLGDVFLLPFNKQGLELRPWGTKPSFHESSPAPQGEGAVQDFITCRRKSWKANQIWGLKAVPCPGSGRGWSFKEVTFGPRWDSCGWWGWRCSWKPSAQWEAVFRSHQLRVSMAKGMKWVIQFSF